MSNNKSNHLIKPAGYAGGLKRRRKSLVVRDVHGSNSTFKRFYQSGGRDYEQYRRWLETLTKSDISSGSTDLRIKEEPMDMRTRVVSILPSQVSSTPFSVHSQQSLPIPDMIFPHPAHSFKHPLSIPINSQQAYLLRPLSSSLSTPTTTSSFEPKVRVSYDHSHNPIVPIPSSSSSLINWSVADVGRFIEKHWPEKNIARKFIQQKIDGRTLPLLTEDHLIRIFKMKLGPALHLLALISAIH